MHISTTKIAFSLEEAFNYIQTEDPAVYARVKDLLSDYADKLYADYPGTRLSISPTASGMQIKPCGVPIFFETDGESLSMSCARSIV